MIAANPGYRNHRFLLPLICLSAIGTTYVTNSILFEGGIIEQHLSLQYSAAAANRILSVSEQWIWLSYAVIPVIYCVRISYVCIALCCGIFLTNRSFRLKDVFLAAVIAEFVQLLQPLLKVLWFSFVTTSFTYDDLTHFSPFSLASLMERSELNPALLYPLQLLNAFEAIYVVVLARQLRPLFEDKFLKAFSVSAISYSAAMLLWVSLVLFITLDF